MKLKHLFIILVLAIAITSIGCTARSSASGTGGNEITLINNKVEIDEALRNYAAVYERQTGVKVNIRSFGGETPYAPSLAAMFNSGTEPEIFVFEGEAGYDDALRSGRITNLSNEPWVRDTDVAFLDPAGNVVGFPVAVEGWGLGYNKALLARAGIDPSTLTNVAAIKAAFERIDAQKAALGIEAVVSMVAGPGMTWVTGLHGVNGYLTLGLPYDHPGQYIEMMLNGQVDNARLTKFAEYYNLLFRYSIRNTLVAGGYDQQLGDYAVGRTVFIHQGNWTDPTFKELGITFDMGYVPHAFLDQTTDGIFIAAPSWYVVNARASAEGIEEAKKFLTAMAGTPEGHDYMVNKAGMVPAFKSVSLSPDGQLSKAVQEWSAQGKAYAWQQYRMPDGFGMDVLGPIFHQMASGQIDEQGFVRLFTQAVAGIR